MALKFLTVTLFFALVVFKPVHDKFEPGDEEPSRNQTKSMLASRDVGSFDLHGSSKKHLSDHISTDYLWMYLVFAYLFSGLAVYLLVTETERIIDIRQEYLGNQTTVTDRTIRLSGIPNDLRSEEKIKDFVEQLEIGKVESVSLCREWKDLDDAIDRREQVLCRLEEAWIDYLKKRRAKGITGPDQPNYRDAPLRPYTDDPDEEQDSSDPAVESNDEQQRQDSAALALDPNRPKTTIHYGPLKLRRRYVDSIEHYEMELQDLDAKIAQLREREYAPTPLAFVTMDSVAACQMAVQAVLDPSPMHLIAKPAPAPVDVVWRNTYMPRSHRMLRGWIITVIIGILTIFWSLVFVPIAASLSPDSIKQVFPGFAQYLKDHDFANSLVTTQVPTLVSTLLFVAVPYLYDWLANFQGMMSQSDVELSVISKNFFFSIVNYFIIFTISASLANVWDFWKQFQDSIRDTTWLANRLAESLSGLTGYYTNLIILQGIGLFPFRLLEFGSVFLYPWYRMASKTPRDFAKLNEPPTFNYGFYLPQVMLIFVICVVYSILKGSWTVLLAGLFYFAIGGFVYKYQLLYAMDHRQHSTGKAWTMICKRMIVAVILFQLTTAGQLALKKAFNRSLAIGPLIIATVWFSYIYSKNYDPLMDFIALRSIERKLPSALSPSERDPDGWGESSRLQAETPSGFLGEGEESADTRARFVNPSLVKSYVRLI